MWIAYGWENYALLDATSGRRLERWGEVVLVRPDPQIIWHSPEADPRWERPNAVYHRSRAGGGSWEVRGGLPEAWTVNYPPLDLRFRVRAMGFKHTGLFPEQAANWEWFAPLIRGAGREVSLLNLFAYTGGATLAAARAGARVTHVDAARGIVGNAKENAALSGLPDAPVRYLVDDCGKFLRREIRRERRYDAVILDPPSYGRGPGGETWKLEDDLFDLLALLPQVLSEHPLFVLLNSYTTGLSPATMSSLLSLTVGADRGGKVECDELGLPIAARGIPLPCGAAARWTP